MKIVLNVMSHSRMVARRALALSSKYMLNSILIIFVQAQMGNFTV